MLPNNDQSHEDFAWLLQELKAEGADGAIMETRLVDGMRDEQIRELFNAARADDYNAVLGSVRDALSSFSEKVGDEEAQDHARKTLQRARRQIGQIESIDFFGADGHQDLNLALRDLDNRIAGKTETERSQLTNEEGQMLAALNNKTWVTRQGVKVDRIASAWLIERCIDSNPTFKFVSPKGYVPEANELRFDMFEAEFTHEGDLCTFEVLLRNIENDDDALQSIGEIVHDIDLKDGKFGRPETEGIANLLNGVVAGSDDDAERIRRGGQLFEDLYRFFNTARK